MIPYKLFCLYIGIMENLESADELRQARSVALGFSLAHAGKDPKTKSNVRKLARRAYPEIEVSDIQGVDDGPTDNS